MKSEEFIKEYEDIYDLHDRYINELEDRLRKLLNSARTTLGEFFISKGFKYKSIKKNHYYYDPKTKVGIRIESFDFVSLDYNNNSIRAEIVYKTKDKFLIGEKGVLFFFKNEKPEKVFNRFRKYMGKTEMKRMKAHFRLEYPQIMLIDDRAEKMKKIIS